MSIQTILIFGGLLLALATLLGVQSEKEETMRRARKISRRPVASKTRRSKIVGAAAGR